jgi:hypothetical protein
MFRSKLRRLAEDIYYALNLREHAMGNRLTPFEKREYLAKFADCYDTFVETGTYLGETTAAMAKVYRHVHTVEIDDQLYQKASQRFKDASSVSCYHGDSALVLPRILEQLKSPAVFWLDGHYSGPKTGKSSKYDTPILRELAIIFQHNRRDHMILIDDARYFIGKDFYPRIFHLREFVRKNSEYSLSVRDDIIRLCFDPEWP